MRVRPLCWSLSVRSDSFAEPYYRSVAALFASLAAAFPDVVKPIISYVANPFREVVLNSHGVLTDRSSSPVRRSPWSDPTAS